MNPNVSEAIKKSAAVPSMPQVVTRFLEVIQDPNFDYNNVVKVLSVDAGMVSEILRLANSALFGVARKVTSLKQAMTLLGPRRTRSLVLGRYLVEVIDCESQTSVDTNYFWRRSLASAVVGARLADTICPKLRDEVFLCALLADIGITILSQAIPKEYGQFAAQYCPHSMPFTEAEEQAAIATSHAEVSAMVLTEWSLPAHLCQAVKLSHDDSVVATDDATHMARVINASDRIAKLLCEIPDVSSCVEVCSEATAFLNVDMDVLVTILNEVETDVTELASMLKIDVISSSIYNKIASAIKDQLSVVVQG